MKRFVEVHYYMKPGKRQAFYDAIVSSGIADAARAYVAETICKRYEISEL